MAENEEEQTFEEALESLIKKGLIEVVGTDDNGDPLLNMTDAGREAYYKHLSALEAQHVGKSGIGLSW